MADSSLYEAVAYIMRYATELVKLDIKAAPVLWQHAMTVGMVGWVLRWYCKPRWHFWDFVLRSSHQL